MVTPSHTIANMAAILARSGVDLADEAKIDAFLRSCGFSPRQIATDWEHARDEARTLRQFGSVLPEMDEVA